MPGNYNSLIDQVAALGNPRMALVIQSDGPVAIDSEQGKFPAVLFSGYNGESQGAALADVLFGSQDPSGHLDFTWYSDDSQLPDMSNYGLTPAATGGLGRTYMYFTGTPTYPFGYGLSYTNFSFSNLAVGPQQTSADGTVNISFDVTNTGRRPGAAVPQLYVVTPSACTGRGAARQAAGGVPEDPRTAAASPAWEARGDRARQSNRRRPGSRLLGSSGQRSGSSTTATISSRLATTRARSPRRRLSR